MERPTKELKLKTSGFTVKVVTFLTRGEAKAVDMKRYEGGKIEYINDEVQIKSISPEFLSKQEDELVKLGTKEITDKDGKTVENTQEFFDSLPDEDFRLILASLRLAQAGVGEEEPSKKK